MARNVDRYHAYLVAQGAAEALLMAHAQERFGPVSFYDETAERKFRDLAADLGFRVEKLPAVTVETATSEAA